MVEREKRHLGKHLVRIVTGKGRQLVKSVTPVEVRGVLNKGVLVKDKDGNEMMVRPCELGKRCS